MYQENETNAVLKQGCHFPKSLWGIFRVRNARGVKISKGYEEDSQTLRAAISGMTTLLNLTNPSPALSGILSRKGRGKRTCGFTLIELLVVVLIIGILAAIALPQYQKAVWRARNARLKAAVKTIAKAQEQYYLEHGVVASDFNQLDIDLPAVDSSTSNPCSANVPRTGIRNMGDYYIMLNNDRGETRMYRITAVWKTGPYACMGFLWYTGKDAKTAGINELYCVVFGSRNKQFCQDIERGTAVNTPPYTSGASFFRLP